MSKCECDNLPEDHPDWMKGMCESCYTRWANAWSSSPCPECGTMTKHREAPKEAPDFVCKPCHERLYEENEEWRADTDARRN